MKADIHVLGSTDGYRTIMRSPGLRSDEEGMLTVLNFGQVESADMAMLGHTPVVHGRQLPSGRYALTRYVSGEPDDVGRPTIELRTIVMDFSDFTSRVRSGLSGLVHDHGFWMGASFAKGSAVSLPRHAGGGGLSPAVRAATAGWQSALSTGSVAFIEDQLNGTPAILETVATVDAGLLGSLRWGVSILSMDIDVDLCTLLPGRQPTSHRALNRIDLLAPPPVIAGSSMEAPSSWNDEAEPLSLGGSADGDLPPGITSDPWEVGPIHEPKRASGLGLPLMIIGGVAALFIIVAIGVVLALLFGGGGSIPAPAPSVIAQVEPVETTPVVTSSVEENSGTTNTGGSSQGSSTSGSDGSRGNGDGGGSGSGGSGDTSNSDTIRESVNNFLAAVPGLDELKRKTLSELNKYKVRCSDEKGKLRSLSTGNPSRTKLEEQLDTKLADLEIAVDWVRALDQMETAKEQYKFDPGTLQHKLYLLIKVHMDAKSGVANYEESLDRNGDKTNDWKDVVWVLSEAGAKEVPLGKATNGEDYRENIYAPSDAFTKKFIIDYEWGSTESNFLEYDFKLNGLDEHDFLTVLLVWDDDLRSELKKARSATPLKPAPPPPLTLKDLPVLEQLLDGLDQIITEEKQRLDGKIEPAFGVVSMALAEWESLESRTDKDIQDPKNPIFVKDTNTDDVRRSLNDRQASLVQFEDDVYQLLKPLINTGSEITGSQDSCFSSRDFNALSVSLCDSSEDSPWHKELGQLLSLNHQSVGRAEVLERAEALEKHVKKLVKSCSEIESRIGPGKMNCLRLSGRSKVEWVFLYNPKYSRDHSRSKGLKYQFSQEDRDFKWLLKKHANASSNDLSAYTQTISLLDKSIESCIYSRRLSVSLLDCLRDFISKLKSGRSAS